MSLTLFDDTLEPFVLRPATLTMNADIPAPRPAPAGETVDAWVKSWADGRPAISIPTLNYVPHDAHVYRPARFEFVPGVRVDLFPASKLPGVRVAGQKHLITLYDAVQRGLAKEVTA